MNGEIFCLARNPIQAKELVGRIGSMGIPPKSVAVATQPWEVEHTGHPDSQTAHDAMLGFIFGGAAGWFLGTAIILMIGTPGMAVYEALLFLLAGSTGGAVLGTVFGASGIIGTSRMSTALEQHFEEEVSNGGILIGVEVHNKPEHDQVMSAIGDFGASDVHDFGRMAA